MTKNYIYPYIFLFCCILFTSCGNDDNDTYVPIVITANADTAEVLQTESVDINVLSNDVNVPMTGTLVAGTASHGTITVLDPNATPDDPSDDLLRYTPDGDYYGADAFEYTICDDRSSCDTGNVTINILPVSPVVFDITGDPYTNLSEYNFFDGPMKDQVPAYGVIPYEPINQLFTDYAHKKRFVWMPDGTAASYDGDHNLLDFPVGTILIKTFYYDNVLPTNETKIIETRLMIKKETEWIFADYIWNDAQDEAVSDLDGSLVMVDWVEGGETRSTNYRIPSESECFTCHKSNGIAAPIALKPQNLNSMYAYMEGEQNQLQKLIDFGYLNDGLPATINTVPDWEDTSLPLRDRVHGYIDINCAHCHADLKHCDYRPIRFAFNESSDDTNIGICVDPDTEIPGMTKVVAPALKERSVMYFRMNTEAEEYRMPLLGRSIIHRESVQLIGQWIDNLTTECE